MVEQSSIHWDKYQQQIKDTSQPDKKPVLFGSSSDW